jgi:hypothetical protein
MPRISCNGIGDVGVGKVVGCGDMIVGGWRLERGWVEMGRNWLVFVVRRLRRVVGPAGRFEVSSIRLRCEGIHGDYWCWLCGELL